MDYNSIQVGRFDAAARKLLGIKNAQVLPVLASELTAQLNLDPMYGEGQAISGWTAFGADAQATAVAAQFGAVIITPPWPNSIMEITRIRANSTASAALLFGVSVQPGLILGLSGVDQNAVNAFPRDTRRDDGGVVIGRVGTMAGAGIGALLGRLQTPAIPTIASNDLDIILHNDGRGMTTIGQFLVVGQTANQIVNFNIEGRMRALDPSEVWPAA